MARKKSASVLLPQDIGYTRIKGERHKPYLSPSGERVSERQARQAAYGKTKEAYRKENVARQNREAVELFTPLPTLNAIEAQRLEMFRTAQELKTGEVLTRTEAMEKLEEIRGEYDYYDLYSVSSTQWSTQQWRNWHDYMVETYGPDPQYWEESPPQ